MTSHSVSGALNKFDLSQFETRVRLGDGQFKPKVDNFVPIFIRYIGNFLSYKDMKNLLFCLMSSTQFAGNPKMLKGLRVWVVSNQLKAGQDPNSTGRPVEKLFEFLLGTSSACHTHVISALKATHETLEKALVIACEKGSTTTVCHILNDESMPLLDKGEIDRGFIKACENGHVEICSMLRTYIRPAQREALLVTAAQQNQLETFKNLVQEGKIYPRSLRTAFIAACKEGSTAVAAYLLAEPKIVMSKENDFVRICECDHLSFLEDELQSFDRKAIKRPFMVTFRPQVGFWRVTDHPLYQGEKFLLNKEDIGRGFIEACSAERAEVMDLLLPHQQLDADDVGKGFVIISGKGNESLFRKMLDKRIILRYFSEALKASMPYPKILELFKDDKRLTTFNIGQAFIYACSHAECEPGIGLLLNHPKLHSHNRIMGFRIAYDGHHPNIVSLLMAHPDISDKEIEKAKTH